MSRKTTTKRARRSEVRIDENAHGMTREKWARLRAKTNEQVLGEARADPDALPVEDRAPAALDPLVGSRWQSAFAGACTCRKPSSPRLFASRSGPCAIGSNIAASPIKQHKLISRLLPENPKPCAAR